MVPTGHGVGVGSCEGSGVCCVGCGQGDSTRGGPGTTGHPVIQGKSPKSIVEDSFFDVQFSGGPAVIYGHGGSVIVRDVVLSSRPVTTTVEGGMSTLGLKKIGFP